MTTTIRQLRTNALRRGLLASALVMFAAILAPTLVWAVGGNLDASFGSNGKVQVRTGLGDFGALSVAIGPRGRIVAAGDGFPGAFGLARYKPNGHLDRSFSGDGTVQTRFGDGTDDTLARSVAVGLRGRIVAAGGDASPATHHSTHFALSRYRPNGHRDRSFSGDGKVTTNFITGGTAEESANSVATDSRGRIVAAGDSCNFSDDCEFALARYTRHGHLDRSFSGNGKVMTDLAGSGANSMAIDSRGRIVAAGSSGSDFAIVRYGPNGSLDPSFGTGGKVTTGVPGYANSMALDSQGRIVVAGASCNFSDDCEFALARYRRSGSLDSSFGTGGKVTTDFRGDRSSGANSMAIDSRGRIVAVGDIHISGKGEWFALARYRPNGDLDRSFSGNGKVTTDFFGIQARGRAVAIDSRDRIVAAGLAKHRYALARYIGYRRR